MNINFPKLRHLMVENQLRPNKIKDKLILELFLRVEKENFLHENQLNIAYGDFDMHITQNRGYLKNLHIAQLIQFSNIKQNDKVLHVGGLTGYVTLLLANLSSHIICLEEDNLLFKILNGSSRDNPINSLNIT